MAEALRQELHRVRLRALLDELAEQLGPADEDMMNQAVQELTGFVCRVRVAEPPERIQLLGTASVPPRSGRLHCCYRTRRRPGDDNDR